MKFLLGYLSYCILHIAYEPFKKLEDLKKNTNTNTNTNTSNDTDKKNL